MFFTTIFLFFLLLALPLIILVSASSDSNNDSNLQNIAMAAAFERPTTKSSISSEQGTKLLMIPSVNSTYDNATYGVKIQYPSDWKLVERGDNGYHMLNVIAEFLQSDQNNYYNANISASHNSLRLSVENYSAFEDAQDNNNNNSNMIDNQLQNIGNHRIGSIGISCPGFDLKSYVRNATLADNPAYQINFDYTYLDNNKKAIEIWTVKEGKVYIIDYVANEQVYDVTVPAVQKMIESFEITV